MSINFVQEKNSWGLSAETWLGKQDLPEVVSIQSFLVVARKIVYWKLLGKYENWPLLWAWAVVINLKTQNCRKVHRAPSNLNGACAHYVMVSKFQWKPFCLAIQRDPQNDWTATQNGVNYDVFAQAPFVTNRWIIDRLLQEELLLRRTLSREESVNGTKERLHQDIIQVPAGIVTWSDEVCCEGRKCYAGRKRYPSLSVGYVTRGLLFSGRKTFAAGRKRFPLTAAPMSLETYEIVSSAVSAKQSHRSKCQVARLTRTIRDSFLFMWPLGTFEMFRCSDLLP